MTTDAHPPVPVPDETSAGFWEAARRHILALARCSRCATLVHPPGVVCPACLTTRPEFTFTPVDGNGRVRSWIVIRDSFLPGFASMVPFVLVDVELDEQAELRLIGRLVDGVDAPIAIGAAVTVVFDDVASGVAVPAFALVTGP